MTEELKSKIDEYVKSTCLYYRSTHEDMLPNQFEKYLRKACIHFATEATKDCKECLKNCDRCSTGYEEQKLELTEQNMELKKQIEKMKVCSNCKHFNNLDDLEYCQNCERQLVNSLDKLPREEIIKDEWQLKE